MVICVVAVVFCCGHKCLTSCFAWTTSRRPKPKPRPVARPVAVDHNSNAVNVGKTSRMRVQNFARLPSFSLSSNFNCKLKIQLQFQTSLDRMQKQLRTFNKRSAPVAAAFESAPNCGYLQLTCPALLSANFFVFGSGHETIHTLHTGKRVRIRRFVACWRLLIGLLIICLNSLRGHRATDKQTDGQIDRQTDR